MQARESAATKSMAGELARAPSGGPCGCATARATLVWSRGRRRYASTEGGEEAEAQARESAATKSKAGELARAPSGGPCGCATARATLVWSRGRRRYASTEGGEEAEAQARESAATKSKWGELEDAESARACAIRQAPNTQDQTQGDAAREGETSLRRTHPSTGAKRGLARGGGGVRLRYTSVNCGRGTSCARDVRLRDTSVTCGRGVSCARGVAGSSPALASAEHVRLRDTVVNCGRGPARGVTCARGVAGYSPALASAADAFASHGAFSPRDVRLSVAPV